MEEWTNLAQVVYKRTYARKDDQGNTENWSNTIERVIEGNVRGHNVPESEVKRLLYYFSNRKAMPAGRGLWFSGSIGHQRLGGVALCNCWGTTADDWGNFVLAQDLLMLGGGVGMSVEHRFVSKLPRIKKDVVIRHELTNDADFIVPDSREGWNRLTRRILESYFITGKSFTYSTICIRQAGEPIRGFGGTSSGSQPLIVFADKLSSILRNREGKSVRPIDAADILCSIGEMVVSGNVRRSAILILGDCWDKEYLTAKRWDLGIIPSQRAMANFSVVCDDVDDLHPLFWKTYEAGEAFGIVNRSNIRRYGRVGEEKKDTAVTVNPCGEATLENGEPCNLQDIALPNISSIEEFEEAAVLMHRWGKRVTLEKYHHDQCQEVVQRNRRVGTSITGCLQSEFFNKNDLDRVYAAIQKENRSYSKELGIQESIRTTVIKPSGTLSKLMDVAGEGVHPGFSRYFIQRIRFSANDALIPLLRSAGHKMEPVIRFDGSQDHNTYVVDFYVQSPVNLPVADEGYDTWKQLGTLDLAQRHWADQAVSITVYYKKEEIPKIKQWLRENIKNIKTISFLCHNDHGFKQAPKEAISQKTYEELSAKIKSIDLDNLSGDGDIVDLECASGSCPIR